MMINEKDHEQPTMKDALAVTLDSTMLLYLACVVAILGSLLGALYFLDLKGSPDSNARAFEWPEALAIATPNMQTASFATTAGWAAIFQGSNDTTVRAIPVDNELLRYKRFALDKEFDFMTTSTLHSVVTLEGKGAYSALPIEPVRVMWFLNDTPWGFVVRADSDIHTIYDLKRHGIKVASLMAIPSIVSAVKVTLPAFLGWTEEEAEENWTFVQMSSFTEHCRSILDGRADVTFMSPISPSTFEMEAHPRGLRWLSLPLADTQGWSRWLQVRPVTMPITIDYGVPSAIGIDSIGSDFVYLTRPDVDQELVYQITKWLHINYEAYKGVHHSAKRMEISFFRRYLDHTPLPVAEGTIRYLREISLWTEEDDAWNTEAITLMDRWVSTRNAVIAEAVKKQIRIHADEPEFAGIHQKHTNTLPIFKIRLDLLKGANP